MKLTKCVDFISTKKTKSKMYTILDKNVILDSDDKVLFDPPITIPNCPKSGMPFCNIMDVKYAMTVCIGDILYSLRTVIIVYLIGKNLPKRLSPEHRLKLQRQNWHEFQPWTRIQPTKHSRI